MGYVFPLLDTRRQSLTAYFHDQTDNLFVVDASIFPGMTTGNPTGAIITVAERAVEKILALK
jgi:choline dehydrogenase-like flavoprotein